MIDLLTPLNPLLIKVLKDIHGSDAIAPLHGPHSNLIVTVQCVEIQLSLEHFEDHRVDVGAVGGVFPAEKEGNRNCNLVALEF